MSDILSRIQISRRVCPESPEQFVALQVARSLRDEEHASDYLAAASRFPLPTILMAYRVLHVYGPPREHANHHFRTVLLNLQGRGLSTSQAQVISIRLDRRAVAVAVLNGLALELLRVRELPSDPSKADASAVGFIRKILSDFPGCMAAIEADPQRGDTRQAELHGLALAATRDAGSPLWQIPSGELIGAFSTPQCRTRAQAREVVNSIWPDILLRFANRTILDAAGLALLIQARRFLEQEPEEALPQCER